jgi:hypothetical protein
MAVIRKTLTYAEEEVLKRQFSSILRRSWHFTVSKDDNWKIPCKTCSHLINFTMLLKPQPHLMISYRLHYLAKKMFKKCLGLFFQVTLHLTCIIL